METIAIQKYIHTTPRKLRLLADMVRKVDPQEALNVLGVTPKAAAKDLSLAIKVALANAKQKGLLEGKVLFKSIEINEAGKMKRYRAGTRGRARPYTKKMSHIKIVLSDELVVGGKKLSSKKVVMDDSAENSKLTKKGKTESSKT